MACTENKCPRGDSDGDGDGDSDSDRFRMKSGAWRSSTALQPLQPPRVTFTNESCTCQNTSFLLLMLQPNVSVV